MSDLLLVFLGVIFGLTVALLANLFVLPFVIAAQDQKFGENWRLPLLGWDKQKTASSTRVVYRVLMPLIFAFIFGFAAVNQFGSQS